MQFSKLWPPDLGALSVVALCALIVGCKPDYNNALPNSAELGSPRGQKILRVITHFHSPYSYDACDKNPMPGGTIDKNCLAHLKAAMCANHVDYLFLTDHPANMANYEMPDLLLKEGDDNILMKNGAPYANEMSGCPDGHKPTLMVGFEGKLMALGMENHLPGDPAARMDLYKQETPDLATQLRSGANSLVVIPHTEDKTFDWMKSINPDAIEIYNIHANLDPKIRLKYLGVPPFEEVPNVLTYLIDPYNSLMPDFAFVGFVEAFPVYFKRWNELIDANIKVAGLGGTDSHENIFSQKGSDGERLDGHRRLTRFMSNHLLVSATDPDSVKAAIKQGRGWMVFEGFGSPVGMDFNAVVDGGQVGPGESVKVAGTSATITVKMPSLHPASPTDKDEAPTMQIFLKKVLGGGNDEVVASSSGGDLIFTTSEAGAYRAEVQIKPRHLKGFLDDFSDLAENNFPWIITNHIFLLN